MAQATGGSNPSRSASLKLTEVYLRQNYHFGPQKISTYLKRYHEITVSPCAVLRIPRRLKLSRLPTSQRYNRHKERWKRYEKRLPGHSVQVDVKVIEPICEVRKKRYRFAAIDDCIRLCVHPGFPG